MASKTTAATAPAVNDLTVVFGDQAVIAPLKAPKAPQQTITMFAGATAGQWVPAIDPKYVWSKELVRLAQRLVSQVVSKNWLLVGPPGCGKTEFAYQLCARTNRPVEVVECSEAIEADALFSTILPAEDTKSGLKRIDGPVVRAARSGATLILDEVTGLAPEVQIALHNLLDGRPIQIRATGDIVTPHKEFMVIATANDVSGENRHKYKGTFALNSAFKSRFAAPKFSYLDEATEIAALISRAPGLDPIIARSLVRVAIAVRTSVAAQLREFSFRELMVAGRALATQKSMKVEDAVLEAYSGKETSQDASAIGDLVKAELALSKAK